MNKRIIPYPPVLLDKIETFSGEKLEIIQYGEEDCPDGSNRILCITERKESIWITFQDVKLFFGTRRCM